MAAERLLDRAQVRFTLYALKDVAGEVVDFSPRDFHEIGDPLNHAFKEGDKHVLRVHRLLVARRRASFADAKGSRFLDALAAHGDKPHWRTSDEDKGDLVQNRTGVAVEMQHARGERDAMAILEKACGIFHSRALAWGWNLQRQCRFHRRIKRWAGIE